jgi:hypothetical protein
VKKSLRWKEREAQYLPAISAVTIKTTAATLLAE